jgi:hypothetical protein
MRMFVSLSGVVRLMTLFFVLGIVVGLYLGVRGTHDVAPSAVDPVAGVGNVLPANETAP